MAHILAEGAEFIGESGKTYLAVSPLGQANVWTAVVKEDPSQIVVLKQPGPDDTDGWPAFQHEMIMHELFKDCPSIRKQLDRIPQSSADSPPMLVLEITETTLWTARTKRPFTKAEIDSIAEDMLIGLRDVHAKGLVYADLKMQNVMLNGFDTVVTNGTGSNIKKLETRLGDLGIVMSPALGKVQPVAYRAPEIHFKGVISEAADIWSWGLIYCHLLEAQTRFSKTGLYDDLQPKSQSMFHREEVVKHAIANDYDVHHQHYYDDCILPWNDHDHKEGNHWDVLKERGLDEAEIEFLQWVLQSDPSQRPTASLILRRHFGHEPGMSISSAANGHAQSGTPYDEATNRANADGSVHEAKTTNGAVDHKEQPSAPIAPVIPVSSNDPIEAGDPGQMLLESPTKEQPSSLLEHPMVAEAMQAGDTTDTSHGDLAPSVAATPHKEAKPAEGHVEAQPSVVSESQPSPPQQQTPAQSQVEAGSSAAYIRNLLGQDTTSKPSESIPVQFKPLGHADTASEAAVAASSQAQAGAEKHPLSRSNTEDGAVKDRGRPKAGGTFLSYR